MRYAIRSLLKVKQWMMRVERPRLIVERRSSKAEQPSSIVERRTQKVEQSPPPSLSKILSDRK